MVPTLFEKVPTMKSTWSPTPKCSSRAAAGLAEHAQRMGFVHEDISVRHARFDRDEFVQRRDIAEHAVDAFDDDQLVDVVAEALQALFEIDRVVVPEADHRRVAELAAIIDAGVAVGVDQDVILRAGQGRNHREIGLVAGREDHGTLGAVELGKLGLERLVAAIGAVAIARAGGAGAAVLQALLRRTEPCLDRR